MRAIFNGCQILCACEFLYLFDFIYCFNSSANVNYYYCYYYWIGDHGVTYELNFMSKEKIIFNRLTTIIIIAILIIMIINSNINF